MKDKKLKQCRVIFKTEHYEMVLKAGDMERCLKNVVFHIEEPRVGQSYPEYYAAKLASKFVKVLSGTGGDELFDIHGDITSIVMHKPLMNILIAITVIGRDLLQY